MKIKGKKGKKEKKRKEIIRTLENRLSKQQENEQKCERLMEEIALFKGNKKILLLSIKGLDYFVQGFELNSFLNLVFEFLNFNILKNTFELFAKFKKQMLRYRNAERFFKIKC